MSTWTHLIRFIAVEDDKVHLGQLVDTARDIGLYTFDGVTVQAFRIEGTIFDSRVTKEVVTVKKLLAPVVKEECTYIRCIGMNYRHHVKEIEVTLPSTPSMFTKPRTALADPFPAPLSVPRISQDNSGDYEAELCVVIGRGGRNIAKEDALNHVLGYTVSNNVSSRRLQMSDQQWSFSKGLDSSCPIGPATYNGQIVQADKTGNIVFGVAELICYLSQGTTLEPGTLILTGTTAGVGFKQNPKIFLQDGRDIRVYIQALSTRVKHVEYEDW
ncbi:uncharacterized protein Z519_09448 [Cladophialophora bantiana CBS 173.52]|uniref:Fumarylacetoacetase-like C-terminal domain-containing protein n=1 Tax=Cladophialophora bantiana (strain ATCC 10958 / CBS 173.52 / CDC B-1940 / NIH 8579) TaxID=1442370 RepID=A0A0D2H9Z1_CLAB1|nr:uncharacterized protein Z519_09448 [Cladophialophora bantiana CBS 173.52]KIW90018.1 hypothetical protein Z519_09448 [Cladophialophora bantiana CBS 173.52]